MLVGSRCKRGRSAHGSSFIVMVVPEEGEKDLEIADRYQITRNGRRDDI
jgi:hypothetical protein